MFYTAISCMYMESKWLWRMKSLINVKVRENKNKADKIACLINTTTWKFQTFYKILSHFICMHARYFECSRAGVFERVNLKKTLCTDFWNNEHNVYAIITMKSMLLPRPCKTPLSMHAIHNFNSATKAGTRSSLWMRPNEKCGARVCACVRFFCCFSFLSSIPVPYYRVLVKLNCLHYFH